jgi:hypothetical protein
MEVYMERMGLNYHENGEIHEKAIFDHGICVSYIRYNKEGNIEEELFIDKNSSEYKLLEKFNPNKYKIID